MANNRQPESKPNHSSSSDEEDEEEAFASEDEQSSDSESQEVSDSDSDDKHKQEPKKPLIVPPQSANKPQPPDLSSSETEESGSETDSDSPPKKSSVVDPNIKPISSRPMERDEGAKLELKLSAKKSGSKTSSTPPPAKPKRPPPAPATSSEKDAKKPKKNTPTAPSPATDDDSKKQLFQRLWSEDDEIVILKGMIDYKNEKNGESPVADMGAFHEFIKKSLHVDVSRAQLVDKVRRLKKKYVNNASREKNGKDRSFSKSHEQKGYELSKLIWGNNSYNSGTDNKKILNQKNNGNAKGNTASTSNSAAVTVAYVNSNGVEDKAVSVVKAEKNMDINRFVHYGNNDGPVLTEEIVKGGMELIESSKREELEEKWNELKRQELELYVKRMDLIKEQALIVLEAVNSSGN